MINKLNKVYRNKKHEGKWLDALGLVIEQVVLSQMRLARILAS